MTEEHKPQEIERLTLDKFNLMIDNVLDKLEEEKKPKVVETTAEVKIEEPIVEEQPIIKLEVLGGLPTPKMVALFDIVENRYTMVFSNAPTCATYFGLHPTTVRARAEAKKLIENISWEYMNEEEFNKL